MVQWQRGKSEREVVGALKGCCLNVWTVTLCWRYQRKQDHSGWVSTRMISEPEIEAVSPTLVPILICKRSRWSTKQRCATTGIYCWLHVRQDVTHWLSMWVSQLSFQQHICWYFVCRFFWYVIAVLGRRVWLQLSASLSDRADNVSKHTAIMIPGTAHCWQYKQEIRALWSGCHKVCGICGPVRVGIKYITHGILRCFLQLQCCKLIQTPALLG